MNLFFFICVLLLILNFGASIESKHEVTILGGLNEFIVKFYGPSGSKYKKIFYSILKAVNQEQHLI